MDKCTAIIHPAPPFNFALTADNQPYFRKDGNAPDTDIENTGLENTGAYQRLLHLGDKLVLATAQPEGSIASPRLAVTIEGESLSPPEVDAAREQVARLLGADQDLTAFYSHAAADPVLADLVQTFYGMHLPRASSVFEALTQAILGQQLAATVARIIRALLIETYGGSRTFNGQLHYAFPRPAAIAGASVDDLRALKLSRRKAEYLQGIARAELDTPGGLDGLERLPDAEAVRELTALRGVGKWTAQWVLVRALGRPDAFPVGDLALRRIVSRLYFGGQPLTDEQLEEFSHRWSPHRSWATHYLFAALRAGVGE